MGRIETTELADDDLVKAALFIARDNVGAAEQFVDDVAQQYSLLAESSGLGRAREELGRGLRSWPFKGYLIFYRQLSGGILIVRFLNGTRDVQSLF